MNKFKVGDKVSVHAQLFYNGQALDGIWEIAELPYITHNQYLCYQKGFDGHDGKFASKKSCQTGTQYSTEEYWYFREEDLMLCQDKFPEIRITTDEKNNNSTKKTERENS